MDDFNNSYNFQSPPPTPPPSPIYNAPIPAQGNGLATTSLVMGICSIVFICCGGGIILGALGIIFAILSRGGLAMNTHAKVGLGLSIGGFALSIIMVIGLFSYSEFQRGFSQSFDQYYNDFYNDYDQNWDYNYEDFFDHYGDVFELPDLNDKFGDT